MEANGEGANPKVGHHKLGLNLDDVTQILLFEERARESNYTKTFEVGHIYQDVLKVNLIICSEFIANNNFFHGFIFQKCMQQKEMVTEVSNQCDESVSREFCGVGSDIVSQGPTQDLP